MTSRLAVFPVFVPPAPGGGPAGAMATDRGRRLGNGAGVKPDKTAAPRSERRHP